MSNDEVKAEIMRKIRKVGYEKLERYYGKGIDESICQPPFFSPDEIEAIIYDKPLPKQQPQEKKWHEGSAPSEEGERVRQRRRAFMPGYDEALQEWLS